MNKQELLEKLKTFDCADIDVTTLGDDIEITINDFEGFDDDWSEIMRELDNPERVDELYKFLDENCTSQVDDFYTEYYFGDIKVSVGYSSYDI